MMAFLNAYDFLHMENVNFFVKIEFVFEFMVCISKDIESYEVKYYG